MELWGEALSELVKMLTEASKDSRIIRINLLDISSDLNRLMSGIKSMIAKADLEYEEKKRMLQKEINIAKKKEEMKERALR